MQVVTIAQVAKEAGVSVATVSRVINQKGAVTSEDGPESFGGHRPAGLSAPTCGAGISGGGTARWPCCWSPM